MPFFGLGLHILVALFFAVHAVRSGQQMYWLLILFSFPLLGSIAYFLVIYLPNSRIERSTRRAVAVAAKALDPERELRAARAAFEETPTAQNQLRVAAALLEHGFAEEAARNYEACLHGPFATDLELRFGAARAFVECGRFQDAIGHLEEIRSANERFRPEALAILLARAYGGAGRSAEARAAFEFAVERFGSFQARAEYAIWALAQGDATTAAAQQAEIKRLVARWDAYMRDLNEPVMRRLKAAQDAAGKRAP